jgi:hypothetical protein
MNKIQLKWINSLVLFLTVFALSSVSYAGNSAAENVDDYKTYEEFYQDFKEWESLRNDNGTYNADANYEAAVVQAETDLYVVEEEETNLDVYLEVEEEKEGFFSAITTVGDLKNDPAIRKYFQLAFLQLLELVDADGDGIADKDYTGDGIVDCDDYFGPIIAGLYGIKKSDDLDNGDHDNAVDPYYNFKPIEDLDAYIKSVFGEGSKLKFDENGFLIIKKKKEKEEETGSGKNIKPASGHNFKPA